MSRRTGLNVRGMNTNVQTYAPKPITLIIAAVLWLIGFAATILRVLTLSRNMGLWALALSGLLLIVASLVEAL